MFVKKPWPATRGAGEYIHEIDFYLLIFFKGYTIKDKKGILIVIRRRMFVCL